MEQNNPKPGLFQLPSDLLYPLIVLAGFAFFVSLDSLPPNDFWWHLKIGELISATHQVPTTNLFSWTLPPDHPFTYGAWLGELLLFAAYQIGKLELVTFLRNLLIVLSFFVIAWEARHKSGSWRLAALAVGFAALMTVNNLVIRTQVWAWLPFALYIAILGRFADGKLRPPWLLSLPVIMAFWVNVHGTFILGGVLVGIFFAGEVLAALLSRQLVQNLPRLEWLLATGVLCGLAMLVNPRGLGSINYLMSLLTNMPAQKLIVEWQPPTPEGIANVFFFISILVSFAAAAFSRRKLSLTELLLVLSFTWLAWTGMRHIVWYSMVVMPILARQVGGLPAPKIPLSTQVNAVNLVLALAVFLPAAIAQPWSVNQLPLPQKFWDKIWRGAAEGPLIAVETPIYAAEYLNAHPAGGHLFNEMGYGSYLIWATPQQPVFIDPRIELYSLDQWEDYIQIEKGVRYNELLAKYGADRILLDKHIQPELAKNLEKDPAWALEYSDSQAEIWKKR